MPQPQRTTLTYTSADAPRVETEEKLFVYYCRYSGRHAFTTDVDLRKLPKRRTDGSTIVDMDAHMVKLYCAPGETKLLKRKDGTVERQYRFNTGKLPIAYQSELEGRFLYVLPDAVTNFQRDAQKAPLPACIAKSSSAPSAAEVKLELDDLAGRTAVLEVTPDAVLVQIAANLIHEAEANQEVLALFAQVLGSRPTQLTLLRGDSNRTKVLLVDGAQPRQVFDKLQAHLAAGEQLQGAAPASGVGGGGAS